MTRTETEEGTSEPGGDERPRLAVGSGRFELPIRLGGKQEALRVWYRRPAGFGPASPVVFVMHGVHRNAAAYRDIWVEHGEAHEALIVAPEFSAALFPGARAYNLGNLSKTGDAAAPPVPSGFSLIERIFEALRRGTGSRQETYRVFGHSAGAQFVHRLVMFGAAARIETAIAANAGWYTLPAPKTAFPYGLGGLAHDRAQLERALGTDMIVLAGEADTLQDDPFLRRTPRALRQGKNRFERAQCFYEAGRRAAERLKTPFAWRLVTVPGIGHDDQAMAAPAARLLFDPR